MPFHSHHHSVSDSGPSGQHDNFYSIANAVYSSGQTLASAGVPNANAWSANRDAQYQSLNPPPQPAQGYQIPNPQYSNGSISRKTSLRYAPPALQQQAAGLPSSPAAQLFPRRPTLSSAMSDSQQYGAPPAYGNSDVNLQIQPPTPGHPPGSMPGSLQPGQQRSIPSQAPQLPPLPQISTQLQQAPQGGLTARPPMSTAHSYSKSSPGNMDPSTPKYKAFSSNTPDAQRYISPSSYAAPSSNFGPSYSPLGLADIRPRTEANLGETTLSPGGQTVEEPLQYPTNSNYLAPWPIFAVDWCKWPPKTNVGAGKIAIGSYLEDNHNYIQILDAQRTLIDPENPQGERGLDFVKTAEANHAYPVTRILWEPPSSNKQSTDLLATSGDHLRLWSLPNETSAYASNTITRQSSKGDQPLQKLSPLALLSNSKSPEHTAPITSLDWNIVQPSLIITSSIDTTCTIWDIPTLTAKTQLIAHDKEVFDVRFCANSVDVFVSCGADGSVRMFDLRSLEHSTIIYEPSEKTDKGECYIMRIWIRANQVFQHCHRMLCLHLPRVEELRTHTPWPFHHLFSA